MKNQYKQPRKGKKVTGSKALAKTVTALVKKEIHKSAEDKYVTKFQATYPIAQTKTAGLNSINDFIDLMPYIPTGNAANERVGNRVTPKSLVVNITISMTGAPTTNSADNLLARLFVLTHKTYKDSASFYADADPTTLLMVDGNTLVPYKGLPGDEHWRVNRREWTVHCDKVLKCQRGFGLLPQAANPTPWIGDQIYLSPNNVHRVTVKIPLPKEFMFVNDTTVQPTNFFPVLAIGYNSPQESTVPTMGEMDYRIAVSHVSHLVYEDE